MDGSFFLLFFFVFYVKKWNDENSWDNWKINCYIFHINFVSIACELLWENLMTIFLCGKSYSFKHDQIDSKNKTNRFKFSGFFLNVLWFEAWDFFPKNWTRKIYQYDCIWEATFCSFSNEQEKYKFNNDEDLNYQKCF